MKLEHCQLLVDLLLVSSMITKDCRARAVLANRTAESMFANMFLHVVGWEWQEKALWRVYHLGKRAGGARRGRERGKGWWRSRRLWTRLRRRRITLY